MLAALRFKGVIETEFQQSIFVGVTDQIDVAAIASIASTGSAAGNEFLAAKSNTAVAAVAGANGNLGLIYEH